MLNLGISGMRDVTSAIISHEQTQQKPVCCFQFMASVFLKDPFIRLFHIIAIAIIDVYCLH